MGSVSSFTNCWVPQRDDVSDLRTDLAAALMRLQSLGLQLAETQKRLDRLEGKDAAIIPVDMMEETSSRLVELPGDDDAI